jgi:FAD:protein FMN transferase
MDALLSPRRRRLLGCAGGLALTGALGACHVPQGRAPLLKLAGESMGSTWSVRIAGAPFAPGLAAAAQQAVGAALDTVVQRMSSFDPASELSRFNRHASATPFALSGPTLDVLAQAQEVARQSAGAFDITVAPLVAAWGFGAQARARGGPLPADADAPVGWQQLDIDVARSSVRKAHRALQIDLSGIAKGYAVDLAAQALEALGIERYMVEAGGEVRTRGLNADDRPWQIAIEEPDAWPQRARRIVPMTGLAMATSGDYRNVYEWDGRRVHHEIDPATRAPAAHALASVSVLHPQCMAADAWATALFVLGPERGLSLAADLGLAALFIVRQGSQLRDIASPAFGSFA